ncbi:hypothetical protein PMZ80_005000 [Knufia obscura]|uniref:Beta-lactamase-related domain-containing protein n=2 Tax=Knufia TaxID=430999 RepID=A0AAN8EKW6_9EURO|nr:hypothetical protein PMZ80_005000 [Knufia obscura]KAK5957663.1 hypothetical protein OHC33_000851 [Knufia fluminis]
MAAKLTSSFEDLVKAKRVPGIGAIVLDKSGKQLYNSSFGTINANDENAAPFTNDTQLLVWSCTKLITSICALQLLEQGKLSLDDPVSKYLPREADVQVCERLDENSKPILRKQKTEMKIIHLMTHTAGYTYDFFGDDTIMHGYRAARGEISSLLNPSLEWQYNDMFLVHDPGTKHHYGINSDKLGFVVEAVSGLKLADYVAKYITTPLGMNNSGRLYKDDHWLRVHIKDEQGNLTAVEAIQPAVTNWKDGGGHFLISTLNDYSQVLLAILNEGTHPGTGNSILKPETVRDYLFRDFIPEIGCSSENIGLVKKGLVPGMSNTGDVGYTFPGGPRGWSCGLMINKEDAPGARKAGSGAWAGMGNQYFWIDPVAGLAGITGSQCPPFMDADVVGMAAEVERFAYEGR